MWAILSYYGGGHFCVPMAPTPEHNLTHIIGLQKAIDFCKQFGGELLSIPKADNARRLVRNVAIRHDRHAGMTNFDLCRKYGLTERHIITICRGEETDYKNNDLFEDI
jgi:Mor family transcriptional regulator